MAGRKIGEIFGEIKIKNAQFNTGLTKSQQRMQAFGKAAKIAFAAMATAALAATAAVIKMTNDTIKYANEIRKASIQTGLAVEEFQALAYAAKQEHTSLETISKTLPILSKYMAYAQQGMETYKREFDKMGITVTDAEGKLKSTYDVLLEMSKFMAGEGANDTEKLAIVMTLLGRRGAELMPMLKKGTGWFKEMGKEAHNLGIIMSTEDVEAIKAFDDKMTALKETVQGLVRQFVTGLLPALDTFAGSAKESAEQTENLRKQVKEMGFQVGLVFAALAESVRVLRIFMAKSWGMMAEGLSKLYEGMKWLPGMGDELAHTGEQLHQIALEFYNQAAALEEQGSWIQKVNDWYKEATDTIDDFGDESEEALDNFKTSVDEAYESSVNLLDLLSERAPEVIAVEQQIGEGIVNVRGNLEGMVGQIVDMAVIGTESFANIADAVGGLIRQLAAAVIKAGILKFIFSALGLSEGGYIPGKDSLKGMQAGGYAPAALTGGKNLPKVSQGWVNQPSVLVGEGRGGELVIPEDKLQGMVQVTIHKASPHTYVDTLISLPQGQKQRLYRRVTKEAMSREERR